MTEKIHRLPRLYVEQHLATGLSFALEDGQAHYLTSVMRQGPGDALRLFNGRHGEFLARVAAARKKNVMVDVQECLKAQTSSPDIHVIAAPVKKDAFSFMIEKACELGAARFTPVLCARSVVDKINIERLHATAVEAAEQCERLDVMQVDALLPLEKYLAGHDPQRPLLFCAERADAPSLLSVAQVCGLPVSILVRAEGGFTPQEYARLESLPFVKPVSLGKNILRAETAVCAAVAVVAALAR